MLYVLAGVRKVELVGGEGWLEHNMIALAAISAALLAALVAILNRRAELRHDREMRNRDHIREMIDSCYQEVGEAITKVSDVFGVVQGTEAWRADNEDVNTSPITPELDRELEKARNQAHPYLPNLLRANSRLEMRLGTEHPVATTHEDVRSAIEALFEHAPASIAIDREQEAREMDIQLTKKAGATYAQFREACFNWINE
jgi:hypothetical protein